MHDRVYNEQGVLLSLFCSKRKIIFTHSIIINAGQLEFNQCMPVPVMNLSAVQGCIDVVSGCAYITWYWENHCLMNIPDSDSLHIHTSVPWSNYGSGYSCRYSCWPVLRTLLSCVSTHVLAITYSFHSRA